MVNDSRGRQAERPGELSRLAWKDILIRTKAAVGRDHLSIVAGGVAFFTLLAVFSVERRQGHEGGDHRAEHRL